MTMSDPIADMLTRKMCIRDRLVDASAAKIIETVKKNGAMVSGPVPLPTKKEVVTILRACLLYTSRCV